MLVSHWPDTSGFALIIVFTQCLVSVPATHTHSIKRHSGAAGIQARKVLEEGQMFPHWLSEAKLFIQTYLGTYENVVFLWASGPSATDVAASLE